MNIRQMMLSALLSATFVSHAGLKHHWAFDGGSGPRATDAVGGMHGAIHGATWATGSGARATYLTFDGVDDCVDPGLSMPTLSKADSSSWAFWVKQGSGESEDNGIIVGCRSRVDGQSYTTGQHFLKITPYARINFYQDTGKDIKLAPNLFSDGKWHHFAFSRKGDQVKWYLDGKVQNGGQAYTIRNLADTPAGIMLPFFMGGEPGQRDAEHFSGAIDDVRIYDHALTDEEVSDLMIARPSTLGLILASSR